MYKPDNQGSCCPNLGIRLHAPSLELSKQQARTLRKLGGYLSGTRPILQPPKQPSATCVQSQDIDPLKFAAGVAISCAAVSALEQLALEVPPWLQVLAAPATRPDALSASSLCKPRGKGGKLSCGLALRLAGTVACGAAAASETRQGQAQWLGERIVSAWGSAAPGSRLANLVAALQGTCGLQLEADRHFLMLVPVAGQAVSGSSAEEAAACAASPASWPFQEETAADQAQPAGAATSAVSAGGDGTEQSAPRAARGSKTVLVGGEELEVSDDEEVDESTLEKRLQDQTEVRALLSAGEHGDGHQGDLLRSLREREQAWQARQGDLCPACHRLTARLARPRYSAQAHEMYARFNVSEVRCSLLSHACCYC